MRSFLYTILRISILVAVVVLVVLPADGISDTNVVNELLSLIFGINVNQVSSQSAKSLQYVRPDMIRLDAFPWDVIEAKKGSYNFSVSDTAMQWARDNRFKVLGIIQYAPGWANGKNVTTPEDLGVSNCGIPDARNRNETFNAYRTYPPKDYSDFGNYAHEIAKRYKDVEYWQIWNEPNNPIFWSSGPHADQYAQMLKVAATRIREANPRAKVILGGISLNDVDYITKLYTAGTKNYFDAMAVHLYNPGQSPNSYLGNELEKLRKTMIKNNDYYKDIWLTEIGWYTGTGANSVSNQLQGRYLEQVFRVASAKPYVGAVFWNTLMDCSTGYDATNPEHNWGIYNSNLEPKEAVSVMRGTMIRR